MNAYNSEKYIEEAINSVVKQSYKNWELIIYDNCSNDQTKNKVKLFKDKRIKYILAKKHSHLGKARFDAEKYLDGEYLGILDSDDIWESKKLEIQIPLFDEITAVIYSNTIFFDKNHEKILYTKKQPSGYIFQKLLSNYNISLESLLIKRECINSLSHFFDPDFKLISDFDLVLRLSSKFKILYDPTILSKWRMHSDNSSKGKLIQFINEKRLWLKKNKDLLDNNSINKIKKKFNIDECLLYICDNDYKKATKIFYGNFHYSLKYFFIFYILKVKFFKNTLINYYKRRINYNELE